MSLSTLKPVTCSIPPVTGASGPSSKLPKVTMINTQQPPPPPPPPLHLQVKEKEIRSVTSRREMMQLTAASLGLLSLLLPSSAEARPRNATMRQKIMEKFEELRQKAGFSKPKDEGQEKELKDEGKDKSKLKVENEGTKPKLKNGGEEKKGPNEGIPVVPALPNIINGKIVETTLP